MPMRMDHATELAAAERSEELRAGELFQERSERRIAIVAHELRNPLQVLTLGVDAMLARIRPAGADELSLGWLLQQLEAQRRSVRRMQQLVDTLLEADRIASGRCELQRESMDLRELVLEVLTSEADYLAGAGCPWCVDAPEPARGCWDRAQVRLATANLVSNAMKYGAGHPLEITVGTCNTYAWVRVRDHGIGIAPENQQRIFERFERVPQSSTMSGFGLGLWLVKSVALAHGGEVLLESAPAEGASFTLMLRRSG